MSKKRFFAEATQVIAYKLWLIMKQMKLSILCPGWIKKQKSNNKSHQ